MLTLSCLPAIFTIVKKQGDFFKLNREFAPHRIAYGDESGVGKRKLSRPFKRNTPLHLIFKSERAVGRQSLLSASNRIAVDRILRSQAKKFSVKMHAYQNVGNHLHCVVSCPVKKLFQNFLRTVASLIARTVMSYKPGKFWTKIPFTRIITGRRDFLGMLNYIEKNLIEATFGKAARSEVEAQECEVRKRRRREAACDRRRRRTLEY